MLEGRLVNPATVRLVSLLAALGLGCAKDLSVPDAPPGQPCTTLEDCAPSGEPVCGALRACVGADDGESGVCEATPSLFRPCP